MSVDIIPVSARTSRKHGGLVAKATKPSDLRVRLHFENQVVTGYRQTGSASLVMRLPVGALPIYARYDVQATLYNNDYGLLAAYGDIWEELGSSDYIPSGGGGDPNNPPSTPPEEGFKWVWDETLGEWVQDIDWDYWENH